MFWLIGGGFAAIAVCLLVRGAADARRHQKWIDEARRNVKWPARSE
jgi:hypothetical protein